MSDPRRALVLHLSSGAEPLLVAIGSDTADELGGRLTELMRRGEFESIQAANGSTIVVNFAHVLAAHIDTSPPLGAIWGSPRRDH